MKMTSAVRALIAGVMLVSNAGAALAATGHQVASKVRPPVDKDGATGLGGWVAVNQDGTIARRLNAKSVTIPRDAIYNVRFNSKVSKCAFTGSIGDAAPDAAPGPGIVTFAVLAGDPRSIYVQTFDANGVPTPRGFFLVVTC